jgi:hypothetical protein
MMFFSFLLVAALASNVFAGESSGARSCPGGYSHGSQMDVDRYWYECQDGQKIPKGCLDEGGRRVPIDGTFETKDYQMQCIQGSDGFLTLTYKACVKGGAHDVGSQWDDGTAMYTCVREGDNVRVVMLGCIDQGRPLKFDDRVAKGDFIYQCKKSTDGSPSVNKVGCLHEGRKYNIGETYEGSKFWYTCTDSGSKVVGCMYHSHRLQDGDHFTEGDMMYACKVRANDAELEPFACMAQENGAQIERKVGCFWVEGDFEYTCKAAEGSSKVTKTKTQCVYRAPQAMFKVQPGCVQLAETTAVGCVESSPGNLRIETYPADQIDRLPGLRRC